MINKHATFLALTSKAFVLKNRLSRPYQMDQLFISEWLEFFDVVAIQSFHLIILEFIHTGVQRSYSL